MLFAPPLAVALLLLIAAPAAALFGCGINPLCIVGKAVGGAISSVAGDAITALAKAVLGALGHAVEWASTLWVGIGTPPVADAAGQPTGTVAFLQQNLLVFTTGAGGAVHADRRRADRLPRAQGRAAARARPLPGDLRAGLGRGGRRGERADRRL